MTALALGALLALAQGEVFLPGAKGTGPGSLQSAYGEPLPVELASLASGTHLRRTVRTRGTLGYIEPGDAFYELSEGAARGRPASADESALDGPPQTKVTVVGRFRGANLEADLPGPPPAAGAWVLTVGTRAVWVIGRRPEGRGFKLDPAYRGDLGRWLEVEGRLTPCAAGICLKASEVVLATPPVADP